MRTAAVIIVGDEILSAKVRDENSPFLASEFRRIGVALRRIVTIGDDVADIGREVRAAAEACDYVVTTGGVGPTHDDVTMAGVARAFDVGLVRHPDLERWLRAWYKDRINDAALKMAEVPEGARIILRPGLRFPPVVFRNIYILPGVPNFLRDKFRAIAHEFDGRPTTCHRLYLAAGETAIAAALNDVVGRFPDVAIGSYPVVDRDDYRVMLTLESRHPDRIAAAEKALIERLGPHLVPAPAE